jgi:hypothetical protein
MGSRDRAGSANAGVNGAAASLLAALSARRHPPAEWGECVTLAQLAEATGSSPSDLKRKLQRCQVRGGRFAARGQAHLYCVADIQRAVDEERW